VSEKRDLKADLEEWHSDLIHGTRKIDWFYLVENYINRAIEAEAELNQIKNHPENRGLMSLLEETLKQKVLILDENAALRKENERLKSPELRSGTAMSLLARAQEEADRVQAVAEAAKKLIKERDEYGISWQLLMDLKHKIAALKGGGE